MAAYWGVRNTKPTQPWSWTAFSGAVLSGAAGALSSVASSLEMTAVMCFASANDKTQTRAFHQEAARELEALLNANYWEVDTDDGVFVADLDEFEEYHSDDEESE